MSEPVSAHEIEQIVGVKRHPSIHFGRAVSDEQLVYVLHSQSCKDTTADLGTCPYSVALDEGIDLDRWVEDTPLAIEIESGRLVPWFWDVE